MRKSLVTEVHPAKGQAGPLTLFGLTTDPMRTKLILATTELGQVVRPPMRGDKE